MVKANKSHRGVLVYGTDSEKNLYESIGDVFHSSLHLLCDLHMKDNIKSKLVELGVSKTDRDEILGETFRKQVRNVKD